MQVSPVLAATPQLKLGFYYYFHIMDHHVEICQREADGH